MSAAFRAMVPPPPFDPEDPLPSFSSSDAEEEDDLDYVPGYVATICPNDPWNLTARLPTTCSFDPMTIEKDPEVLGPSSPILAQGVKCQRLGESGWNRIRYAEAEKVLKRGAVFQPLTMNAQCGGFSSKTVTKWLEQHMIRQYSMPHQLKPCLNKESLYNTLSLEMEDMNVDPYEYILTPCT
ncbi:hypothetical protein M8J77_014981 [Diaphorina citri]|nr:hypothetical protein M8J77_014981 [Diaphorina citri]